jgi:hypothetical protein
MEGFFSNQQSLLELESEILLKSKNWTTSGLFDSWSGDQWGVCGRMVGVVNGQHTQHLRLCSTNVVTMNQKWPSEKEESTYKLRFLPCQQALLAKVEKPKTCVNMNYSDMTICHSSSN